MRLYCIQGALAPCTSMLYSFFTYCFKYYTRTVFCLFHILRSTFYSTFIVVYHLLYGLLYLILLLFVIFTISSRTHLLVWARPVEPRCHALRAIHGPDHVRRAHEQPNVATVHGSQGPIPSSPDPQRHVSWSPLRSAVQLSLPGDRQSHPKGSFIHS